MPSNLPRPWRLFDFSSLNSYEKGSLQGAMVDNPRTALWTHPVTWEGAHLKVLSYELHTEESSLEVENNEATMVSLSQDSPDWENIEFDIAMIQTLCLNKKPNHFRMRHLIRTLSEAATGNEPERRDTVELQYGGRTVAYIHLPLVFFDHKSQENVAWAYVDGTMLDEIRHEFLNRYKRISLQERILVTSFADSAIKRIEALPIDPLYIAIMISLAQKIKRAHVTRPSNGCQKVSLFVPLNTYKYPQSSEPGDKSIPFSTSLTLYSAEITYEYLQKFAYPYRFSDAILHISQKSLQVDCRPKSISDLFDAMCVASGFSIPPAVPAVQKDQKNEGGEEVRRNSWAELFEQIEQEGARIAAEHDGSDTEVADD